MTPAITPELRERAGKDRRIIASLSGGEGSWLAARTYIDRHAPERFEVLFTDTLIEDQDTYRFLIAGAANLFGIALPPGFLPEIADFPAWEDRPLYKAYVMTLAARVRDLMPGFHWIADGRDPFDVYEHRRFLGNSQVDPCSLVLKRDLADRWLSDFCDPTDTTIIVGIDDTERARFEGDPGRGIKGLRARKAEKGWCFVAPLIDHPLMPWDVRPKVGGAGLWQQRLSRLGFSHSNCGGHCCKGGQAHWKRMLQEFPERYSYVEWREQSIRAVLGDVSMLSDRRKRPGDEETVKRPLTLADLRHRVLTASEAAEVSRCACSFGDDAPPASPLATGEAA